MIVDRTGAREFPLNLEPTLTPADDVTGADHPWKPGRILFHTFIGGFAVGGTLLLFNETKMGLGYRRLFWMVPLVLLLWVGWIWGVEWAALELSTPLGEEYNVQRIARLLNRLFGVLLVWYLSGPQRRRYGILQWLKVPFGRPLGAAMGVYLTSGSLSFLFHQLISRALETAEGGGTP